MKDKWSFADEDFEFLEDVAVKEVKMVARDWSARKGWTPEKAEANARGWLHRIRIRGTRCQNYTNRLIALQRKSPRVRKFTISGALETAKDEPDEETPVPYAAPQWRSY